MVERAGLENRNTCKRIVGSNPTLSASSESSSAPLDFSDEVQSQVPAMYPALGVVFGIFSIDGAYANVK